MELDVVRVDKPDDMNVIIGQAHFIKTIEDVHEALVGVSPQLRFGVAFCEASGPCLVRRSGNDERLVDLATQNALAVGAGHSFLVFLEDGYPVNVLNALEERSRGVWHLLRHRQPGRAHRRTQRTRTRHRRGDRWAGATWH